MARSPYAPSACVWDQGRSAWHVDEPEIGEYSSGEQAMEVATLILSGVITIATVVYACLTFRMMSVMKATHEIESRPYLAFDGLSFTLLTNDNKRIGTLKVGIIFRNPGKVLTRYDIEKVELRIADGEIQQRESLAVTRGGSVFPGSSRIFFLTPADHVVIDQGIVQGAVEYELRYAVPTLAASYRSMRKLNFVYFIDAGHYEWVESHSEET